MKFASAMTAEPNIETATEELVAQIRAEVPHAGLDLALLFLSPDFEHAATYVARTLRTELDLCALIGGSGEAIIGHEHELEDQPAMSLVVARLPGVQVKPFALHPAGLDDILDDPALFRQSIQVPPLPKLFLLIGDPYSVRMDRALDLFNAFHAEVPVVGGMVSAPQDQNVLIFNDRVLTGGLVGVALSGALEVDVVVSQGCRPVGPTLQVTRARENLIFELDGRTPVAHIRELARALPAKDHALLQRGLYLGRAIRREGEARGLGDFLVRGIMGVDEESGAIAVADYVRRGETIQFHLHDAAAAQRDLEMLLSPQVLFEPPRGALLFTCNGRGSRLYGHLDGDISIVQRFLGNVPAAGMFCVGEIGPIGGENHLLGHTASLALFRPPSATGFRQ